MNKLRYIYILVFLFTQTSCRKEVILIEKRPATESIEIAHNEIWRRFVNEFDCINDYTDLDGTKILPTPEELQLSKPNALGWWTPMENASMFGGLYMDGIIKRWENTKSPDDAAKVIRIAKGLMLLASVSKVEGFVARGVTSDGKSHYAMGSNDQMGGWFYGMFRYLETSLPSDDERKTIIDKMLITARALVKSNWLIPAEPPFNFRSGFGGYDHNVSRLLFVEKAMYVLTKDEFWNKLYLASLKQKGGDLNKTRLEIVADGLNYFAGKTDTWDESPSISCLRLLWEIEKDPVIKEAYRQGLENSATIAMKSLYKAFAYLANDPVPYELDWRKMNLLWSPQTTPAEADAVALAQLKDLNYRSKKRDFDVNCIREPAFAAWVVSLAPDETLLAQRKPELEKVIRYYEYDKIYEVWFFPLIATWYRIYSL